MKTFTRLGIGLLFVFFSVFLKAAPIAGGHISYRAIDSVTYVVTAQIFAECDSINPNVGDSLLVSWAGGSFATKMSLVSVTDVTGLPNHCTAGSGCWIGSVKKIYEHRFTDTVSLPTSACQITFAYAYGKRSAMISTGPASSDFYIDASLNRCNGINNSSHITLPPQFYIAVGQDAVLSAGYMDSIDGDSLSFALAEPRSPTSPIAFSGSWSYQNPINYLGFPSGRNLNFPAGIHLDSVNGGFSLRPTAQNQVTVLTFEAIEYHLVNGVMVEKGRTRLEYRVMVMPSVNNKLPKVTNYHPRICEGQQFCHTYITNDADGDSTHISWNYGIPGATLSVDSSRFQKATFCWTPTPADISNTPHVFTLEVNDGTCTFNGIAKYVIAVYVKPRLDTIMLEVEKKVECNKATIKFRNPLTLGHSRSVTNLSGGGHVISLNSDSAVIVFLTPGWAKIKLHLTNGNCSKQIEDSVYIDPPYNLNVFTTDTTVCPKDTFSITAIPVNGEAPYYYKWTTGETGPTISTRLEIWQSPSRRDVLVVDKNGCAKNNVVVITVKNPIPPVFGKPDSLCKNAAALILPVVPPGGKYYGNGIINASLFYPDSAGIGFHTLLYSASDSNGCKITGTKTIRVLDAPPTPQFAASTTIGGVPLSVNFVNQSIGPVTKHVWIFTRADNTITDTVITTNFTITKLFNDTGKYNVTLINYSGICTEQTIENNYITVRSTVGIKAVDVLPFIVYPNPAREKTTILWGGNENISGYTVSDITGKDISGLFELTGNELHNTGAFKGVGIVTLFAEDIPYTVKITWF
ncbi:MAG TPA: hypothetical protein VEC12_03755 [Bacteroidia bacterium]|nr:hypothetical protein [Bacteroidia bacterium]